MTEMVFVMASSVVDFGGGLFGISLPVRELTPGEAKLLQELFPHTERVVQRLLIQEALMGSIVTDPVIPIEGEPTSTPKASGPKPRARQSPPAKGPAEGPAEGSEDKEM